MSRSRRWRKSPTFWASWAEEALGCVKEVPSQELLTKSLNQDGLKVAQIQRLSIQQDLSEIKKGENFLFRQRLNTWFKSSY